MLFSVAVLLLLTTFVSDFVVDGHTLLGAVILTRHGSRTKLSKDVSTFKESPSFLTNRGKTQMMNAGFFLREAFTTKSRADHDEVNWTSIYADNDFYAQSSDLDRTLLSAQSFLLGLYPPLSINSSVTANDGTYISPFGIEMIPIHSVSLDADILLRGWDACPNLNDEIEVLHQSEAFLKKEKENESFLLELEKAVNVSPIKLQDIYNIYDSVTVDKVYNGFEISDSMYATLEELASYVERERFSSDIAQRVTAEYFVRNFVSIFASIKNETSPFKIYYYSGHYPLFLALFESLGLTFNGIPLATSIPPYGSVLTLEFYDDFAIDIRYRAGTEPNATFDLCQASQCTVPNEECTLLKMETLLAEYSIPSINNRADWCNACGDTERCKTVVTSDANETNNDSLGSNALSGIEIACVVLSSLILLLLLVLCLLYVTKFISNKRNRIHAENHDDNTQKHNNNNNNNNNGNMDASLPQVTTTTHYVDSNNNKGTVTPTTKQKLLEQKVKRNNFYDFDLEAQGTQDGVLLDRNLTHENVRVVMDDGGESQVGFDVSNLEVVELNPL